MRRAKRALASSGRRFFVALVDQVVEIGKAAQRLGGDGMGEPAILRLVELAGGAVERGLERQTLAQDRIEQAQGGAARRKAGRIRRSQLRRPSGSSALARLRVTRSVTGGGE